METFIYITIIFLVSFFVFFLVLRKLAAKKTIDRRLAAFLPTPSSSDNVEETKTKKNLIKKFIALLAKSLNGITFSKRTEKLLGEAGSMLRPEEYLILRILTSVAVGIFSLLVGINIIIALAFCVFGFFLPQIYMNMKRKKRLNILSYQLIDTLGMMSNSLRAGFSFMQAMQLAGKEVPDPLGPEFQRTVREVGLGVPIEEVFESMINRLPNKELEVVIRAILAQRKSGGNLAELMGTMEETIRGRIRVLEELKTLTAQGRMSSWIITLLPVGLGLYLYFANPDYFAPMTGHPLGWMMLSVGTVSIIIGWGLIQKIIKIEV